tara:strand:- start:386 stop:619 length:234 start_codon:yes stop_codon:yes gene_type:complete
MPGGATILFKNIILLQLVIRRLKYGSGPKSGPELSWKYTKKPNCKLDDLRDGFETAEGYGIGHDILANVQSAVISLS